MKEAECLEQMVYPDMQRPTAYRKGIIQVWVTRACDKSCFGCTQGSNLGGRQTMITPEQFEEAVISLKDYFGVVGVFGGNPAIHPRFDVLCELLRKHIPFERRGLWCNNLLGKGAVARATFNPAVCNLNVHLDQEAYAEFKRDWPESNPFGQHKDSRHAPAGWVSMRDLGVPEEERWELISKCDINRYWSAMIGVFRGELRGWFCEIAGAQSILHQENPAYPDTGVRIVPGWWQGNRDKFHEQIRYHCHSCGVPLRGFGSLAQDESGVEQVSASHADIYKTKKPKRLLQIVDNREQLQEQSLRSFVDYIGNAKGK